MSADAPPAAETRRPAPWLLAIFALLALAAALRLAGIFDDFWLDEIWSWRIARGAHSAADLLFSAPAWSDNNHPLNTLLLYLLGDQPWWPVYRLPALLAGLAAVAVSIAFLARTRGRVEALAAALLLGLSYPLVVYSSEARGYALMLFFAVAAFAALHRFLQTRSWPANSLFVLACLLGFLSHLTFAHFYLAALVLSAIALLRQPRPLLALLWLHLLPLLFAAWLYTVFARHLTVGGAPEASLAAVIAGTLSLLSGGPTDGPLVLPIAILVALLLLASLVLVWHHRRDLAVFYAVCVFIAPALFLAARFLIRGSGEPIVPRYFLVPVTFAYLLLATAAGILWSRRSGRIAVIALLACFAAASLAQTVAFLRGTRGHYLAAVEYMADTTPGPVITVSSDNPFRTNMLLGFYARYLPRGKQLAAAPAETLPDWLIINSLQAGIEPQPQLLVAGTRYSFAREFTYYGLSGWSWYLYHRQSPPPPSSSPAR